MAPKEAKSVTRAVQKIQSPLIANVKPRNVTPELTKAPTPNRLAIDDVINLKMRGAKLRAHDLVKPPERRCFSMSAGFHEF